ncbi:MAG: hypothetical protein AB1508_07840 [Pseudomonadota bacterium]
MVSPLEAQTYVERRLLDWGYHSIKISSVIQAAHKHGDDAAKVVIGSATDEYGETSFDWFVWRLVDGTIYGEW